MPTLAEYIAEARRRGFNNKEISEAFRKRGYSDREIAAALEVIQNPQKKITSRVQESNLSYIEKIGLLFSSPTQFFTRVHEPGIKDSFFLILITALAISALSVGLGLFLSAFFSYSPLGFSRLFGGSGAGAVVLSVVFFCIGVGITFIYAGMVHLTVRLMGGTGNFSDTYNACTYGSVPAVIISIIPIIGLISSIYAIVVISAGLEKYHQISRARGFVAALIPVIVVAAIFIILIIFLFLGMRGFY